MKSISVILLLVAIFLFVFTTALPTEPTNTTGISAAYGAKPKTISDAIGSAYGPPRDRGPMSESSLAPPDSDDMHHRLFNASSSIESSLAQESRSENKCWYGSPWGCSKGYCWKVCGDIPGAVSRTLHTPSENETWLTTHLCSGAGPEHYHMAPWNGQDVRPGLTVTDTLIVGGLALARKLEMKTTEIWIKHKEFLDACTIWHGF